MKLELLNFRKYKKYCIEFTDSKCILLKGISGVGKSTILESIRWCLYGKLRDIYNYNIGESKKPVCSVILTLQNYKITRSKNPESLELIYESVKYNDEIAQNMINLYFGDYKFWNYSIYCVQNENNILLDGSERDKIDLLNTITFLNCDPSEYIDKIGKYIKDLKVQIEVANHKFNYELQKYNEFLETYKNKIISDSLLDSETLETFKNNILITETQLESMYKLQICNKSNLELYNTYTLKIAEYNSQLSQIQKVDLSILKTQISDSEKFLQRYKNNLQSYTNYKNNLESIYKLKPILQTYNVQFDSELYSKITELESQICNKTSEFENCNFKYKKYKELYNLYKISNIQDPNIELNLKNVEFESLSLEYSNYNMYTKNLEYCNTLKNQISVLESQKPIYTDYTTLEVEYLKLQNILKLKEPILYNNSIKNKINELESKILNYIYNSNCEYIIDYNTLSKEWEVYNYESEYCNSLNLEYSKECISNFISQKSDLLYVQSYLNICKTLETLIMEYSKLQVSNLEYLESQLQIYNTKYLNSINSKNLLQCPHCSKYCRINDSILLKSSESPISDLEISEIKTTIQKIQTDIETCKIKQNLESQILYNTNLKNNIHHLLIICEKYNYTIDNILDSNSINLLEFQIQKLKNFQIINKPVVSVNDYNLYLQYTNHKSNLDQYKSLYNLNLEPFKDIDFINLQNTYDSIGFNLDQIKTQNSNYTKINIQISQLQKIIADIDLKEYTKPLCDLESLKNTINVLSTEAVKYNLYKKELEQLYLELQNPKLEDLESQITYFETTLHSLENQIQNFKTLKIKYQSEYSKNTVLLSEYNTLKSKLEYLESLQFDFDSDLDYTILETELYNKLLKLKEIYDSQLEINTVYDSLNNNIQSYKKQLSELQIYPDLDSNILKLQEYLTFCKTKIQNHTDYTLYLEKYNNLNNTRNEYIQYSTDLKDSYTLENIAKETERNLLENTINLINAKLNDICNYIFDSNINVNVNLYKTLKNDNLKHSVNVNVSIDGVNYNIKNLSGGEKNRISLALTLALNSLNSCPFMLLDECMANVDELFREKCLKSIRYNTSKTLIIVSHVETEGYYDSVITLE
jgi:DNA repair exonuclease SbcCD ATPase subunit